MRLLIALLLIIFIFPGILPAEEVLWPLDIEISQSSSFAEFRGMRFHAGIDLRTQQKNGFPVRAVADGFISRASVQFRGYGYALYLDHPQLKARVVYGHLQDFSGPLKGYIDAKLKQMGQRHGINDFFTPDRFPVKKGQIVAFSGDSGMGPSHLHFEMRTFTDEPLAPSLFGYRPADNIYPEFHKFYVLPCAYMATVDGSFLPAVYRIRKAAGRKGFCLDASPMVSGRVAMQVGISDSNGAGNRFGIEKLILTGGGKTLLERTFHQYSYDDNRQCPWVYDYFKSNEKNTGYVFNLFKLPFDTLPMAKEFPEWSGCLNGGEFAGSAFEFEVTGTDFGNNSISAAGNLRADNVDFSRPFTKEMLDGYEFGEAVQTDFSFVAIGTKKAAVSDHVEYGRVEVKDQAGKIAEIPCILKSGRAELAFAIENRWQKGAWLEDRRILPETRFVDQEGGVVELEAGGRAEFKKDTLNFPVFAAMRKIQTSPPSGGNARRGWLKPHSAIWQLTPDKVVFNSEATVSITPDQFTGDIHKLGIYEVDENGNYSHNGEKVSGGNLNFSVRTGGKFVILQDLVPPVLNYIHRSTHFHLGKCYVFKSSDIGKGVDWLSASAEINGAAVEVYSDPDKSEIYVVCPDLPLPHKIVLKISDQAGNSATMNRNVKG